ncbi:Universal stress protein [Maioricimonas rarisocia]|uniref:Universal stress protein n=1 Tax=Maioricimonas rarisocia TaxID=2528026 RepID=A0A517ZCI3_9PLAN|nr:universal stress protein [Maioricimonas rarisocia]QDU40198.1 Universal stress protein [Maioricimonas rarisocia]
MKILLATDGSSHAQAAESLLQALPVPADSELSLISVLEAPPWRSEAASEHAALRQELAGYRREVEERLDREVGALQSRFASVTSEVREGHVVEQICAAAGEQNANLIVAGARGGSRIPRWLVGGTTDKLARHAPCDVLVVRPGEKDGATPNTLRRILVAIDGSPSSRGAVERLASLPLEDDCEVIVFQVLAVVRSFRMDILEESSDLWEAERRQAHEDLAWAAERLRNVTPNVKTVLHEAEYVSDEILTLAQQKSVDLIVVGHQGRSRVTQFLLGSVSAAVLRHAGCSVWIVRSEEPATA